MAFSLIHRTTLIFAGGLLILIAGALYTPHEVIPTAHGQQVWAELTGYANDNFYGVIGLVSMNCSNDGSCLTVPYKVEVDIAQRVSGGVGNLRGLAFNPIVGWITFTEGDGDSDADGDLDGCPNAPCVASVDWTTGELSGWARVLTLEEQNGSANDVLAPGSWISLNCDTSGVPSPCGFPYSVFIDPVTGILSGSAWMDGRIYNGRADMVEFQNCFGETAPFSGNCGNADFVVDGVIGLADFNEFRYYLMGADDNGDGTVTPGEDPSPAFAIHDIAVNGLIEYGDFATEQKDFYIFQECFGYNSSNYPRVECFDADFNGDNIVSQIDFQIMRAYLDYDVDGNGVVHAPSDGYALDECLGETSPFTEFCELADINGDGTVGSADRSAFDSGISAYDVDIDQDGYSEITGSGIKLQYLDFSSVTANFMTNFACGLADQYGRKMIQFDEFDGPLSYPVTSSIFASSVDEDSIWEGVYEVTLATYDSGHPDGETSEEWHVEVFTDSVNFQSTANRPDLPDYATYADDPVVNDGTVNPFILLSDSFITSPPEEAFQAQVGSTQPDAFYPVCAAFDYACPLDPNLIDPADPASVTIVNFQNSFLVPGDYESDLFVFSTPLPAGVYDIYLGSYDEHSKGESTSSSIERWHVKLFEDPFGTVFPLQSGDALDLTSIEDFRPSNPTLFSHSIFGGQVNFELAIPYSVPSVQARHISPGFSGPEDGDVTAVCAAFDYVGAVPSPPTVNVTPDGTAVAENDPITVSWAISGVYSSCTASSNPVNTGWDSLSAFPATGSYVDTKTSDVVESFTLSCTDGSTNDSDIGSYTLLGASIPACGDTIDNDGDGFIDFDGVLSGGIADRGCDDGNDSDEFEAVCISDGICEALYGENPINCSQDCSVLRYQDVR